VGVERSTPVGMLSRMVFNVPPALLKGDVGSAEFAAGALDLTAAGFQLLGHAVEGTYQVSDFVGGAHLHAIVETAAGNLLSGFRKRDEPGA